jgi:glycosyltransferase involved in cell wall biosynthesis
MKILFLVPYPVGESPSQRFRFEQYFDLLKKNGVGFSVESFWSLAAWKILYKPGNGLSKTIWLKIGFWMRFWHVIKSLSYDWVFIHRECAPVGPPVFEFIMAKVFRKKIIYDFDDAIWLPNTSEENKLASWLKFHGKVKFICRWSYRVSCGNAWLADFARQFNSNVVVNPTTIDTEGLHNPNLFASQKKKNERVVIGWTGTHSTLPYLTELIPVLQRLEKKFLITVRIISNKNPGLPLQTFEFVSWKKETEIQDLNSFDIGLMPLTDDAWAKGKCGFKALQYMALEIPCLASPVGVNTSIIKHSVNGFLCQSPQEWEQILEKLILEKTLRNSVGKAGRQTVVESFSVLSNTSVFLGLTKS